MSKFADLGNNCRVLKFSLDEAAHIAARSCQNKAEFDDFWTGYRYGTSPYIVSVTGLPWLDADPAEEALRAAMHGGDPSLVAKPYRYQERGLPCRVNGEELPWCVAGLRFNDDDVADASGVLEWCRDEQDANERLRMMSRDTRYKKLKAMPIGEFDFSNYMAEATR